MDMGISQGQSGFDAVFGIDSADAATAPRPLDWQGLRARFAAAYAARGIVRTTGGAPATASFDSTSALALHAYPQELAFVNPNASSDVKPDGGIDRDVAGGPITGDRGPK